MREKTSANTERIKTNIDRAKTQLSKALERLDCSYQKTKHLASDPETLGDDDLERWESLLARFARTVDLFTSKYLRLRLLLEEPGFRGSTRDPLDLAEKHDLIKSADRWFEIKELRNKQAHDYEDEDLKKLFESVRTEIPFVLELKKTFQ